MNTRQAGSGSIVLATALAAIATVTILVQNYSAQVGNQKKVAEVQRKAESKDRALYNAIAQYKALLTGGSGGIPAIMPVNYFQVPWQYKIRTDMSAWAYAHQFAATANSVSLKLPSGIDRENDSFKVFLGQTVTQSQTSPFSFSSLAPDYVRKSDGAEVTDEIETIDFAVYFHDPKLSHTETKDFPNTRFRLPIPPPNPSNAKLKYRLQNSSDPWQDLPKDFLLQGAKYEVQAFVSGIALGARIYINGLPASDGYSDNPWLLGIKNGEVTHGAVSYDSVEQAIGRPVALSNKEPGDPLATHRDCSGSTANTAITANGDIEVVLEIVAPDGTSSMLQQEFTGKVDPIQDGIVSNGDFVDLTREQYMAACPTECPWYSGSEGVTFDAVRKAVNTWKQGAPPTDIATETFRRSNQNVQFKGKLCVDFYTPGPGLKPWMNEIFFGVNFVKHGLMVGYELPGCKRIILEQRQECGCLTDDTLVLLGDGKTQKRITDLQDKDTVWNPIKRQGMRIKTLSQGPEKVPLLAIEAGPFKLKATGNHPFPTPEGMIAAFNLKVGDKIMSESKGWVTVDKVYPIPTSGERPVVWNIEVDAPHNDDDAHHFVANGVVTGDLFIQKRMEVRIAKQTSAK